MKAETPLPPGLTEEDLDAAIVQLHEDAEITKDGVNINGLRDELIRFFDMGVCQGRAACIRLLFGQPDTN